MRSSYVDSGTGEAGAFAMRHLDQIKAIVAEHRDAPEGVELYAWVCVDPLRFPSLVVPVAPDPISFTGPPPRAASLTIRSIEIVPMMEDRHAGLAFRVGWDEETRTVALWVLE